MGKCSGTTIMYHFFKRGLALQEYHYSQPPIDPRVWYFLWVRNPLTRFVSAFNHSKEILDFDSSGHDHETLTLANCPAPAKVRRSVGVGFVFTPLYDRLVDSFTSANELAESLSSSDLRLRRRAHDLMTNRQEHIFRGTGWHLHNGLFVQKFHKQFVFVGRTEYFREDFLRLQDLVAFPEPCKGLPERQRTSPGNYSRDLSAQAIKNLRKFYAGSDYKALGELVRYGLLDSSTLDEYNHYQA